MPRRPAYDRDDLINQAKDLFWRQGWAGTSLKDLEAALELNPGSIYAAFGSKSALFELALDRYAEDGLARLAALVSELGPLDALKCYPKLAISKAEAPAKACMLSKTLLELHAQGHSLAEVASGHLLKMETAFSALFAQCQSVGLIAMTHDPDVLARRYQSDLLGLRISAERKDVDADAIAQEIADGIARL
ncbi:MAG: TetR/AcrR family transcriptional regulator [Pseudomonadota bacterium]